MRIEGNHTFQATVDQTFMVFTEPGALYRATPGIQSMEQVLPNHFEAIMKMGISGISGTYKGHLELKDLQPPEHYALALTGDGKSGYIRGSGTFDFRDNAGSTIVTYSWDVEVGGLFASVGQRVLGGVAKVLIGQFMTGMARELATVESGRG